MVWFISNDRVDSAIVLWWAHLSYTALLFRSTISNQKFHIRTICLLVYKPIHHRMTPTQGTNNWIRGIHFLYHDWVYFYRANMRSTLIHCATQIERNKYFFYTKNAGVTADGIRGVRDHICSALYHLWYAWLEFYLLLIYFSILSKIHSQLILPIYTEYEISALHHNENHMEFQQII